MRQPLADVTTFAELEVFLRTWRSMHQENGAGYDFGGMMHLLGACLDNLGQYALDSEMEDVGEYLTGEQQDVIREINRHLSAT